MILYPILPFIAFVVNIVLGLFVLYKSPRNKISRAYSVFSFALAGWALMDYFIFTAETSATAMQFDRIRAMATLLAPLCAFYFVFLLTKTKIILMRLTMIVSFLIALLFLVIRHKTNLIVESMNLEYWGYALTPGALYPLFLSFIVGLFLVGTFLIYRFRSRTALEKEKKQTKFLLIAFLFSILSGAITEGIFPVIGITMMPLASTSTTIMAIIIFYSIIKYQLMLPTSISSMRIQTKITLPIILTVVIVLSIATSYSYLFNVKSLETTIHAHLETAAQSDVQHVGTVLEMYEQRARLLTSKTWMRKHLKSYLGTGDEEYKIKVEEIIADVQKENPKFLHISIMNPDGKIIISTIKDSIGKDVSNKDFFINGKKDYTISDLHEPAPDGSRLHISGPLIQDGEFFGVVAVACDGKTLERAVAQRAGLGETGEIYLINKDSYMITPSRFKEDTFLKEKVDTENSRHCFLHATHSKEAIEEKHAEQGIGVFSNYRGVSVLGTHIYIPEMNWCLLAEIEEREALAPTKDLLIFSIIRIFIVSFIFLIVTHFLAKIISKPIVALHKGTEIIEKGNFDHKVGTDTKDEIGQLSRAFDKVTSAVRRSRADVDKKVKEQTREILEEQKKIEESKAVLEKMNASMVGRELKMVELKKEIERLKNES
jgi:HAMP domain-containing protein